MAERRPRRRLLRPHGAGKASKPKQSSTPREAVEEFDGAAGTWVPKMKVGDKSRPTLSVQLATVAGVQHSNHFEVTKLVWAYIKTNNLQNAEKKNIIDCDDNLRAVFGRDQITAFAMSKFFKQHMFPKDDPTLSHNVTTIVEPETKPKDPEGKKGSKRERDDDGLPGSKRGRAVSDDNKPFVSTQLANVIGKIRATQNEAFEAVRQYVYLKNLCDASGDKFACDEKLLAVFKQSSCKLSSISKSLKQHIISKGDTRGSHEVDVTVKGVASSASGATSMPTDGDDDDNDGDVDGHEDEQQRHDERAGTVELANQAEGAVTTNAAITSEQHYEDQQPESQISQTEPRAD